MIDSQHVALEAHPQAATLYLTEPVSVVSLLEAFRRCDGLPDTVWSLRVDMTGAEPLDEGTRTVLAHLLRRTRQARGWVTHVSPALAPPRRRFMPWRRRATAPEGKGSVVQKG